MSTHPLLEEDDEHFEQVLGISSQNVNRRRFESYKNMTERNKVTKIVATNTAVDFALLTYILIAHHVNKMERVDSCNLPSREMNIKFCLIVASSGTLQLLILGVLTLAKYCLDPYTPFFQLRRIRYIYKGVLGCNIICTAILLPVWLAASTTRINFKDVQAYEPCFHGSDLVDTINFALITLLCGVYTILLIIVVITSPCRVFSRQKLCIIFGLMPSTTQSYFNTDSRTKFCSVCTVSFQTSTKIWPVPCKEKHYFHPECIQKWFTEFHDCPTCKEYIDPATVPQFIQSTTESLGKLNTDNTWAASNSIQ